MKAKLMAILMVVGLGVTSVAATAQAAEARAEELQHVHNIVDSVVKGHYAVDYDEWCHKVYYTIHHVCSGCPGYDTEEVEYERHDYENVYDGKGNMIFSYCTECGVRV